MRTHFGSAVILVAAVIGCTSISAAASAAEDASQLIRAFDADHNGTLDVPEVTNAGRAKFGLANPGKSGPGKDGTLNSQEAAKARIDKKQLAAADPNKDGTLDMKEFMNVLDARFKSADADKSGTIDAKELSTDAGKALLGMLGAA